jgi:serine/threonine protein kinase
MPEVLAINDLQVGDQLDRYRIDALVARSGMACIYRATDTDRGTAVAIKVPHFEVESDPLLYDRFKREDAIGRKLDHPRIMKVFGDERRTRLYMVMEWLDGRKLRSVLAEEKKLAPERAIRIALGVLEALEYIHGQGVVHRDLKPENILLDSEDNVKLIDFGIASSAGSKRLTFARFTRNMGTPDYVSPEQVKGSRGDARSDLYSLGVILYEMLTGEVPFQGDNPLIVLNQRLTDPPIPPCEADPQISLQLQEILYRALERNSALRYLSANDFKRDLQNPEAVVVKDRPELQEWRVAGAVKPRKALLYAALALLPFAIVVLLLISARHH